MTDIFLMLGDALYWLAKSKLIWYWSAGIFVMTAVCVRHYPVYWLLLAALTILQTQGYTHSSRELHIMAATMELFVVPMTFIVAVGMVKHRKYIRQAEAINKLITDEQLAALLTEEKTDV